MGDVTSVTTEMNGETLQTMLDGLGAPAQSLLRIYSA